MKDIINQFAWIEVKGHEWMMIQDVKIAMEQYAKVESQFHAFKADELEKLTDSLAAEIQKLSGRLTDLQESLKASQEENQRLKENYEIVENNEKYYRDRLNEKCLEDQKIHIEHRDNRRKMEAELSRLSNELESCRADKSKT